MVALYIIGGIAALIALLCITPAGVRIVYDGEFKLYAVAGLIQIKLIPKKKKIKISSYSEKALERQRKKEEKKAKKKAKKEGKPSGKPKKEAEKKDSVLAAKLKNFDTAPDMIEKLLDMVSVVANAFAKRIKITIAALDVTVGSPDAAKTAVIYGAACSAAGLLSAYLDQFMTLKMKNKSSIRIAADFLSEKTQAAADVKIMVRVGGMILFLFEIRKIISEILSLLQEEDSNG